MKTTILSLCMAFAIALNAQFIPQPMGYNPDSNSDGAIGSEDLMGMLSLYGTEFDNGDSTEIFMVDFVGVEDSTFVIPESTDICFIEWLPEFLDVPAEENPYCINEAQMKCVLPAGNTLKFMSVIMKMGWKTTIPMNPHPQWNINTSVDCYGGSLAFEGLDWRRNGPPVMDDGVVSFGWTGQHGIEESLIFVRHLDGTWHRM